VLHRANSRGLARLLAILFACTTAGLAVALAWSWMFFRNLALRNLPEPPPRIAIMPKTDTPVSPLLVLHQLDLPGRGEIFPALSVGGAQDYWPVAVLSITNQSDRPVLEVVSAQVAGWSRMLEQTVTLAPHETRALSLAPELLPDAYSNEEIRRATLAVRVLDPHGAVTFAQSRPVLLHSASDLYWGKKFANAQYVARWVTPHDPAVLRLVAEARKRVPGGRLRGYNAPPNASPAFIANQVRTETRAVFEAMRASGISYVSSIYTFGNYAGEAQRIRLPAETLSLNNANCIDVSVAFASALENLGLRPVIVIVPGHAFVGVRLGPQTGSQEGGDTLYLDLTVLPKGTLNQAIARAQSFLKKFQQEEILTVDVAAARVLKVYPLPRDNDAPPPAVTTSQNLPVPSSSSSRDMLRPQP
jgi:hypothetical protein